MDKRADRFRGAYMVEKDLENSLVAIFRKGLTDRDVLRDVPILSSTSNATCLHDLIGNFDYELFQDTSDWNPQPKLMIDVAGGTTPDIVIRSRASGENRIYIEVKLTEEIRGESPLSQVVRQFLHLLTFSRHAPPKSPQDIRRALLLAAPSGWFEKQSNLMKWRYFLDRYTDLASLPYVNITLGELRLDAF